MLSTPRPDVARWKRRKLLMNVGNAVQALVGVAEAVSGYGTWQRAEAEACFAAAGFEVASIEEDAANREGRMESTEVAGLTRGGGSSWQSLPRDGLDRGRLSQRRDLSAGSLHGVPTPVNALLQRRANAAAAAGLAPGSTTEEEAAGRRCETAGPDTGSVARANAFSWISEIEHVIERRHLAVAVEAPHVALHDPCRSRRRR